MCEYKLYRLWACLNKQTHNLYNIFSFAVQIVGLLESANPQSVQQKKIADTDPR